MKAADLWPFVGRKDVFAVQFKDGHYEPVRFEITIDDLQEHLDGRASYGTYVITPTLDPAESWVNWLVFDLDTYSPDAYEHLVTCLTAFCGIVGERSNHLLMENSGGKGFHAWLFLSEPLTARQVRSWVRSDFLPRWGKVWELEVFPKQDQLAGGGFGNLVKLPFGVHAKSGRRSTVVNVPGWASDVQSIKPLDVSLIPEWSPEADAQLRGRPSGVFLPDLPCERQLLEKGCNEGGRNITMRWLAHRLLATGWLSLDEVLTTCRRWNQSLFHPPLSERELVGAVGAANDAEAPHPSCHGKSRSECPGGPLCTADWNERPDKRKTWKAKSADAVGGLTPRAERLKEYQRG